MAKKEKMLPDLTKQDPLEPIDITQLGTNGIELIAEERQRQIEIEGYSAQHDSQHNASELIYAAIAYVESAKVGVNCSEMGNTDEHEIMRRKTEMGRYYPFGWSFKPSTDIRDLVKAGALIAAAIDRLESTDI